MNFFKRLLAGMVTGAMALSLIAMQEEKVVFQNSVSASTLGNLTYKITNDEVVITGCDRSTVSIEIPAEIEGYPVTKIASNAFRYCYELTEVIIPDSVTDIGNYAFYACLSLTKVIIPDSVTNIRAGAFRCCSELAEVTISDSVTNIGYLAFYDCTSLAEVTLYDSVTSVGDDAFGYYGENGEKVKIDGFTIFGYKGSAVQAYSNDNGFDFISIGEMPSLPFLSYTIIDGEVTITSCDSKAMFIEIPAEIEGYPVTDIKGWAFKSCYKLTEVVIPDSVTQIGNYAFYSCTRLNKVEIPNSVTSVGEGTFLYCRSLTDIVVDDKNRSYCDINGVLFNKNKNILISYPIGRADTSYTIPSSATTIEARAFERCINLTEITISDSVLNISDRAFQDCRNLTNVVIPSSVINIGENAFGFYFDYETYTHFKVEGFTISGHEESAAQAYADLYDLDFISLDNPYKKIGDPSGNGKITAEDAFLILQFTAEAYDFTDEQFNAADVSGDGEVNALDALLILQYEAELISEFPKG